MSSPNPDPQRPRAILIRFDDKTHEEIERQAGYSRCSVEEYIEGVIKSHLEEGP